MELRCVGARVTHALLSESTNRTDPAPAPHPLTDLEHLLVKHERHVEHDVIHVTAFMKHAWSTRGKTQFKYDLN